MEAYCVKCKKKTEIKDSKEVTMKNGRQAITGMPRYTAGNISIRFRLNIKVRKYKYF